MRQKSKNIWRSHSWFQLLVLPHTLSSYCKVLLHWLFSAAVLTAELLGPTPSCCRRSHSTDRWTPQNTSRFIQFIVIFSLKSPFQQQGCLKMVTLDSFPYLFGFTKNYLLVKTRDKEHKLSFGLVSSKSSSASNPPYDMLLPCQSYWALTKKSRKQGGGEGGGKGKKTKR